MQTVQSLLFPASVQALLLLTSPTSAAAATAAKSSFPEPCTPILLYGADAPYIFDPGYVLLASPVTLPKE